MSTATMTEALHPNVGTFVAQTRKMLINGRWVNAQSGKTFPTYDPATGEVLAKVTEGDKADIDLAVQAARKAFEQGPWRKMTSSDPCGASSSCTWRLAMESFHRPVVLLSLPRSTASGFARLR